MKILGRRAVLGVFAGFVLAGRLWAVNYQNITLQVTLVAAPTVDVTVTPGFPPVIYNRDNFKVPVTVTVTGNGLLEGVRLFYRPQGAAGYTEATGTMGFTPDPAGLANYHGQAVIPGSAYAAGVVELYIEVTAAGGTFFSGTPAMPLSAHFEPRFETPLSPAGGTVVLPDGDTTDGNTSITFPPGALSQDITLSILSLDPNDSRVPPGGGLTGSERPVVVYDIDAEQRRFNQPVTLSLLFPDVDATPGTVDGTSTDEMKLRVFWWDGVNWRLLGGAVNSTLDTVTSQTTHFTLFALFPVGALSPQSFRPLERIITPNGDGINDVATFAGLSGGFEIRIHDVSGRLIRTVRTAPEWDGRNDDGKVVENGSYLYQYRGELSSEWVSGMIGVAQ